MSLQPANDLSLQSFGRNTPLWPQSLQSLQSICRTSTQLFATIFQAPVLQAGLCWIAVLVMPLRF